MARPEISDTPVQTTPTLDQDLFRTVAGYWPTGVSVITTIDADRQPYGLTANAVTSLSLRPLQYLVCIDNRSTSLPALLQSRIFCVNFLSEDQEAIARIFASKKERKFDDFGWRRLPNGLPVIDGGLAQIGCEVAAVHAGGDHSVIIGQVTHLGLGGGNPLVYFRGNFDRMN
jgi:3-hydroxy-9,10-secoandrosta-1,3,5(10)-triene-9,17-dione monooxygenase reductase component